MELRILVVEDSPTQAEHLRLVLEDAGYQVEVAVNGREGLERAVAAPPDLIISDIVMPDMDGFAFCAAAKSHEATRRIPFVLLTERRDVRDIVIGLERGADNFIPKPVDDEELVKLVRLILEHHLARQEGGDRPGALSAEGPSPGATILVVDDEPAMRELIEEYLVLAGYRVMTADSAERALAIVHGDLPDLVVTDVNLAGMSGIELCARLKANPRFQFIPVIILTAVADLQARLLGLSAGADDFFSKPMDFAELRARVRSLLRLKRLQDQLEARTRLLFTLLGRYVSEDVAAEIVSHPGKHLGVGGVKRAVTILFGDLRGFTPLADTLDPQDVVEILNAYLSEVVDVVFECGGTLDKFRGDGIMAIFGAPLVRTDDAARAVRCALALQERVKRVRFARFPDLCLHMGIGINTGTAIVGTIGSQRRMDYTAVGGEVNLAQRFEASAGPGQILITETTYASVKDMVQVRELGALRVSGKSQPVPAFDVLGPKHVEGM